MLTSKIEMTTNCNIGSRYETSDSLKSIGGNFFVKNTNMEELRHDFENLREHQFIDVF